MQKFHLFVMMMCHLCVLNVHDARAGLSLEEEFTAMKGQLEVMQQRLQHLEERVLRQETEIQSGKLTRQVYEEHIQDMEKQLAQRPVSQAVVPAAVPKWTPDLGVVADVVFKSDSARTDTEGSDRLSLRELEIVFGSDVDPYSRLDAMVAFSDTEDPSLEEAYLTRFGLPWDTTARVGKFKPKIGKVLSLHRDSLDTVDEPLVIQRYFGVEGLNKSGVDVSKILDLPLPVAQQVIFGVIEGGNGEEGTVFGSARRRPTIYSHLKNYADITEQTGFELGFSHMMGSRDADAGFEVQVLGVDATLTQHFNATRNMKFQGEVFNLSRQETEGLEGNLWGSYGLVDLRFLPQWSAGFRFDTVELMDHAADNLDRDDTAYTGYLTFYQSEFARWRAQFTYTDLATGREDNAFYIQGTFAIGDHKHKLQ